MRAARWVLLIYIHAVTATNPRSVNLALETTFEFNEKKDMTFIKNMRKFFDKVENNIERKLSLRDRPEGYRFTDFLQEIIAVLNAYDDADFRSVLKELYHVINNQRRGGAELNDIISNSIRPALLDTIRRSTEISTRLLKDRLKRISLLLKKTDKSHASFVNFLNLLYKGKSPMTLKRIIKGFRLLRKRPNPESHLKQLVRNAVEYLVYEHYAGLDASVKRDVGKWLRSMLNRDASLVYRQTKKPKLTSTLPSKRHHYSFVTLYPEPIDLNLKRYPKEKHQVTAWKRVTMKDQGRFLLIKNDRRSNTRNVNGASEESSWSSLETSTVKRIPTSIYRKLSHRKTDLVAPSSLYVQRSHRREINQSSPIEVANVTGGNYSISELYLDRLKQIERQLTEMKKELKARMYLQAISEIQTDIEYDKMATDPDSLETSTKQTLEIELKTNETEKTQTRFRTALGNKSLVLGDSQLSTEIKEFLKKKPQILNVSVANVTRDNHLLNATTNSTIDENIVIRSRDITESSTVTVLVNAATELVVVSETNANVTAVTPSLPLISTNATSVGQLANTTSKSEYMNNTIII